MTYSTANGMNGTSGLLLLKKLTMQKIPNTIGEYRSKVLITLFRIWREKKYAKRENSKRL